MARGDNNGGIEIVDVVGNLNHGVIACIDGVSSWWWCSSDYRDKPEMRGGNLESFGEPQNRNADILESSEWQVLGRSWSIDG